jgi:hypothetical protein
MSRIVRKKAPAKKAKPVKRRLSDTSSSLDLSDDYGYSGVEDISDSSDDDEDDVNAVEEDSILKESLTPPRPSQNSNDSDDENELDDDDEAEIEEPNVDEAEGDGDESTSWAGIVSEPDESQGSDMYDDGIFAHATTPERHVHFDVPYSDSDSTATEDDHADIFPDIFVDQHSLDPSFRREIEDDAEDSSGSGSYWDYRGHYDQFDVDETTMVLGGTPEDTGVSRNASVDPSTTPAEWNTPLAEPAELDGYESESCQPSDMILQFANPFTTS